MSNESAVSMQCKKLQQVKMQQRKGKGKKGKQYFRCNTTMNYATDARPERVHLSSLKKSAKSLGFQFIVSEAEFLNEADGEICTAVVATWSGYHLCRCLSRKSHMKSKKVLK